MSPCARWLHIPFWLLLRGAELFPGGRVLTDDGFRQTSSKWLSGKHRPRAFVQAARPQSAVGTMLQAEERDEDESHLAE
jgi:hypothetical protein